MTAMTAVSSMLMMPLPTTVRDSAREKLPWAMPIIRPAAMPAPMARITLMPIRDSTMTRM